MESEGSGEDGPLCMQRVGSGLNPLHRPHWPACPPAKGPCLPFCFPAGEPWQHLDPGLPQRLLEEKERVLAVLRETVKVQAWAPSK